MSQRVIKIKAIDLWMALAIWPLGIRDRHRLNGRHIRGGLLCIGKARKRWIALNKWPLLLKAFSPWVTNGPGFLIVCNKDSS